MKFPQAGRLQATVQNQFLQLQLSEHKHGRTTRKQEQIYRYAHHHFTDTEPLVVPENHQMDEEESEIGDKASKGGWELKLEGLKRERNALEPDKDKAKS